MIHLDLQPEVEAQLAAEALARGIALDRLVEEMSRAQFGSEPRARVKSRTVAEAVNRILRLREETSLDGLKVKDLIDEGRKY